MEGHSQPSDFSSRMLNAISAVVRRWTRSRVFSETDTSKFRANLIFMLTSRREARRGIRKTGFGFCVGRVNGERLWTLGPDERAYNSRYMRFYWLPPLMQNYY